MSGKKSRTKGHSFEREIAQKLRDIYPDACRQLEYQENQCNGVDLANTGSLKIQCKRSKHSISISKIKEIKSTEGIHCLISKKDREKTFITLDLESFLEILKTSSMR